MDNKHTEKKQDWIIAQHWSHVLFLSFKYDPDLIRQKIPSELEVDTYDGSAWLSIVPFRMSHIRFRFTPVVPFVSLWELNLRTYVTYKKRPGIYFFTLDTDSWLGQKVARYCFHLPYRFRKMSGQVREDHYRFESQDAFKMEADLGSTIDDDALDTWLVERYHLYTKTAKQLYRGDVIHKPWQLREANLVSCKDNFLSQFGFNPAIDLHTRYAESMDVRFRPFVKLL